VKGKSLDQNILLGKSEMVADKEAKGFELRRIELPLREGSLTFKYLVVLDQIKKKD
jgi:hypothetical protein